MDVLHRALLSSSSALGVRRLLAPILAVDVFVPGPTFSPGIRTVPSSDGSDLEETDGPSIDLRVPLWRPTRMSHPRPACPMAARPRPPQSGRAFPLRERSP